MSWGPPPPIRAPLSQSRPTGKEAGSSIGRSETDPPWTRSCASRWCSNRRNASRLRLLREPDAEHGMESVDTTTTSSGEGVSTEAGSAHLMSHAGSHRRGSIPAVCATERNDGGVINTFPTSRDIT